MTKPTRQFVGNFIIMFLLITAVAALFVLFIPYLAEGIGSETIPFSDLREWVFANWIASITYLVIGSVLVAMLKGLFKPKRRHH
jgi:hypothetical protein